MNGRAKWVGIVIAIAVATWTYYVGRIDGNQASVHGVELQVKANQTDIENVKRTLDRIEDKLDRLLEK